MMVRDSLIMIFPVKSDIFPSREVLRDHVFKNFKEDPHYPLMDKEALVFTNIQRLTADEYNAWTS